MGCSCGGKKKLSYRVTYKDGRTETFSSSVEAQTAIRTAKGGTMRAVQAT